MSFIQELKRRNVIRAGLAYLAASWLLIQVADTIFPAYGVHSSTITILITILGIGFLPVLIFAWAFEFTAEGLRRDQDVNRSAPTTIAVGKNLDRVVIALLAVAIGYFAVDKYVLDPARDVKLVEEATLQGRTQALVEPYGDKSIVVLPFINMSSDPEQEYLSDGISEELLNLLARLRDLRVISRLSAFSYKGKQIDLPTVARELNVNYVLEGSVRKSGNKIRITAQLIDARTDSNSWSATYDRTLEDIFVIQDEIAAAVVDQLKIELLGAAPTATKTDPVAYALYLKARHLLNQRGRQDTDNVDEAEMLLEDALNRDPNNVDAMGQLARVYNSRPGAIPPQEAQRLTREMVNRMLNIDPDHAFANGWLAWFAMHYDHDLSASARHVERALMLGSTSVEVVRGLVQVVHTLGRRKEAIALAEFVVANDPMCAQCQFTLAWVYRLAGRLDDAEAAIRAALILLPDASGFPLYRELGRVLLLKGDPESALDAFENEADEWQGTAMALHDLGRLTEFNDALQSLKKTTGVDWPPAVAYVYAWIGDKEAALDWLYKAKDSDPIWFTRELQDPVYDNLHDDSRYWSLLEEIGTTPEQLAELDFKITLPPTVAPTVH